MSKTLSILTATILLTLALQAWLLQLPAPRHPQLGGHDLLDLLFGETRSLIGDALLAKADDYLHGGVKHSDCSGIGHDHADHCPECTGHDHDDHAASAAAGHAPARAHFDPWQWLNRRIQLRTHQHLEAHQTTELLPWLWSAYHADPHNVSAYESAAYVLERMLQRPHDATNVLHQGMHHNPTSATLELSLAEVLLRSLHDSAAAAQAFAGANRKCDLEQPETHAEQALLKGRALFYLGHLALERHDLATARACLAEARATIPDSVATRDLQRLIDDYQMP